jgi:hypothetical protein
LLTSVYYSILEQIELNVELTVATPLIIFFLPDFPVSNAANIVLYCLVADSGTHKVLPLFAISCNNIFVATLLNPFFLKVASVTIWHIA